MIKVLNHDEFMLMVMRDLNKTKNKKNEADCYLWEKARMVGKKAIKHRQRQPHWKSK